MLKAGMTQVDIIFPQGLELAGFRTVIVNELTNSCLPGYLYTPESLVTGGYETVTSMMGPEFGNHLVETVLRNAAKVN